MTKALKPCRSPYCECIKDQCTHPGFYDARHEPFEYPKPPYRAVKTYTGGKPAYVSLLEDEKSSDFDIQ